MTMDFTKEELEGAALLVVGNEAGEMKWSSTKKPAEVVAWLRHAAQFVAISNRIRMCAVCGCTDLAACEPPCTWVDLELCSSHGDVPL